MVSIQSLIQYFLVALVFFGQLGRINILGTNLPLIDIFTVFLVIIIILKNSRKTILKIPKITIVFLGYSLINLIIKNQLFGIYSPTPYLYFLRLSTLILLFQIPQNLPKKFANFIKLAVVANIFFGLFQYLLWPDLTYLKSVGWDDHLNRLVSTYFDPTFTGLIYLLFFIWSFEQRQLAMLTFTFIAIALTYSRSTYLSLLSSAIYSSVLSKKYSLIFLSFALVLFTIVALPRRAGEGTKLERVSSIIAKSTNTQEGLGLFIKHPITGIGYNNIPTFKKGEQNSHSIGGYDSSLLNILITQGVIGFIMFAFVGYQIFSTSSPVVKTMIIALLIHSLFANSLFYPHSTVLLAFIYHLEPKSKYRK